VPAREALTLKVLGRTIEKGVYSLGRQAVWTALKGPKHAGERALDVARTGAAIARDVLQDPIGLLDWLVGLVEEGSELATQFGRHVGTRHAGNGTHSLPTHIDASSIRVRLPSSGSTREAVEPGSAYANDRG